MRVFCILFLLLLMAVCVSAQSSPDQSSVSPQFEVRGLVAPSEFRAGHVPEASPNGETQIGAVPLRWLAQSAEELDEDLLSRLTQDFPEPCYSIRTYRVTRDDPQSDITRPAGYSECETAGRFQMKVVGNEAVKSYHFVGSQPSGNISNASVSR
jgi:hypothetical protein